MCYYKYIIIFKENKMRKLSIIVAIVAMLVCLLAISVGAKELTKYCDAKITLTSGEEVTAYFEIGSWNGKPSVARDTIYKTTNMATIATIIDNFLILFSLKIIIYL